ACASRQRDDPIQYVIVPQRGLARWRRARWESAIGAYQDRPRLRRPRRGHFRALGQRACDRQSIRFSHQRCHGAGEQQQASRSVLMRHAWGGVAGFGLLLGGCMVGPDYVTPAVPITKKFKEATRPVDYKTAGVWVRATPGDA